MSGKKDIGALFSSELPPNPSMRDVFDFCSRHGIEALAQGMIELPPPVKLRQIASALLAGEEGHTYRTRTGEPAFLDAVKALLASQHHTVVSRQNLLATSGVTGAIFSSLLLANRRGVTRVGVTNPYYTYHGHHIALALDGAPEPVFVQLHTDLNDASFGDFNWDSLQEQLEAGMGALIVANPGNPSGKVYSAADLKRLVEATGKYNCLLIMDEIYADLVWGDRQFYSPIQDELHKHVIVCRGFSKNLACQSWRVGYLISHADTVADILACHDPIYISVPLLQHAIATYLTDHMDDYKRHIGELKTMMQNNLAQLGPVFEKVFGWKYLQPDGSMYAMFRHNEASDLDAVLLALKRGVGIAGGSMFFKGRPDNSGLIRIHVGLSEERVANICKVLLTE